MRPKRPRTKVSVIETLYEIEPTGTHFMVRFIFLCQADHHSESSGNFQRQSGHVTSLTRFSSLTPQHGDMSEAGGPLLVFVHA